MSIYICLTYVRISVRVVVNGDETNCFYCKVGHSIYI